METRWNKLYVASTLANGLFVAASLGIAALGCGSGRGGAGPSLTAGTGGPSPSSSPSPSSPAPHPSSSPSPEPSPSSGGGSGGSSVSAITGTVTRVNGTTASLGGVNVAALSATGTVLARTTTDSLGNYSLDVPSGIEVELEVADDAAHEVKVAPLGPGEHAVVRCHVDAGIVSGSAESDPRSDDVRSHLSGSLTCEIEVYRSGTTVQVTVDPKGATAGESLHLVDAATGIELAHMTAAADGTAHADLSSAIEGDLELRDDAGTALAAGRVATLARDAVELESRENGLATALMNISGAAGTISASADDDGDELEVEVEHLAPGASVDVQLETQPGALSSVGTMVADARGRARLKLGGSSLPGRMTTLVGRKLELGSSSGPVGSGSVPELSPDF